MDRDRVMMWNKSISCIFAIVNGATLNGTVYIMMDGSYQFVPNIIDEQRGAAYGSYEQSSLEIGWGVLNLAAGYSQSVVATDYQLMKAAGMLEGILTWRYLNDSEYRPNATKNDKRAIRRRACSFVLRDGLLYFTEDGTDSTAKQWIVDKESQMKVITSCHDQKLGGGHFGRDKTLQKICSRFYWRDMTKHIKEEAVLPVQLQLIDHNQDGSVVDELHVENDTVQSYATQLEKIKKELFPKVDVNIKKAQKKQKELYDERCTPEKYQIGDLVLVKNMRNLSRAGGKTDEWWTGPYAIVNIHEKGLYRLRKLSDGKQLANNINESRLKPFHERITEYSNGSSQNLGEKQVLGSRDENVILNEKSITSFDDEHAHSKQVRQDAKLLDTANSVLKDQLYSSHLLRLWRTGAANFSYSADEDDFDPSSLHFNEGKATVHSESDKLNTTSGHLLDREKRDMILSSTGWLDDVIINAAQDLLKEQFEISGFQNTTLGCNLSFDILRTQQRIPVSCSCRMPPAGRMIQCSHCKEQFHKKCERVTRNELSSSWQCRLCAKK
eukprot:Em0021g385a